MRSRSAVSASRSVRSLRRSGTAARLTERGSVTAEFAVVIPAVVLVLAFCLAGVQVTGQNVRLQDVASDAARILGRGESVAAAEQFVARTFPAARLRASSRGDAICVDLHLPIALPGASAVAFTHTATSCALAGGR